MQTRDPIDSVQLDGVRPSWWVLGGSLAVYGVLAAVLFRAYLYHLNPDGVSYISIAEKYLRGDWQDGVNGYWGPLWSWLLVPMLWMGVPALVGAKVLQIVIGGVFVGMMWVLTGGVGMGKGGRGKWGGSRGVVQGVSVVLGLSYALRWVTPDLLLVVVLMGYLAVVVKAGFAERWQSAAGAGVLGGVAYLCKSYALPFCAVHMGAVLVYAIVTTRRWKEILVAGLAFGAGMMLVVAPWAGVISYKYGHVTVGTSGAYNFARDGPGRLGEVLDWGGLFAPPNESAVSAWEDPVYLPVDRWSPVGSREEAVYFLRQVRGNLADLFQAMIGYSWIGPGVVGLVLAGWWIVRGAEVKWRVVVLALAVVLYPMGYLVLHVESRFCWIMAVAVVVGGVVIVQANGWKAWIGWVMAGSFAVNAAVTVWSHRFGREEVLGQRGLRLKNEIPVGARVASDGHWRESQFLVFMTGGKYFGSTGEKGDGPLGENQVEYLLVWDGGKHDLAGAERVGAIGERPEVYKLRVE